MTNGDLFDSTCLADEYERFAGGTNGNDPKHAFYMGALLMLRDLLAGGSAEFRNRAFNFGIQIDEYFEEHAKTCVFCRQAMTNGEFPSIADWINELFDEEEEEGGHA